MVPKKIKSMENLLKFYEFNGMFEVFDFNNTEESLLQLLVNLEYK